MRHFFFLVMCVVAPTLFASAEGESGWDHVRHAHGKGVPIHLVLGAYPQEHHVQAISPPALRIFVDLDTAHRGASTHQTPFLREDFNKPDFWTRLAFHLPSGIDTIYCDVSVTRFILWSLGDFKVLMEQCLKPGGMLYLPDVRLLSEAPQEPLWIPLQRGQIAELVIRDVDPLKLPWFLEEDDFKTSYDPGEAPSHIVRGNGGILTCVRQDMFLRTPNIINDVFLKGHPTFMRLMGDITSHDTPEGYPDIGFKTRTDLPEEMKAFSYIRVMKRGEETS